MRFFREPPRGAVFFWFAAADIAGARALAGGKLSWLGVGRGKDAAQLRARCAFVAARERGAKPAARRAFGLRRTALAERSEARFAADRTAVRERLP